jgi:hypothetical protein
VPLMETWVGKGQPQIAQPGVSALFVTASGQPMAQGDVARVWQKQLAEAGKPVFPPQRLRHIFVEDRLDNPGVPGPSHEDAAMVMGNSLRQWKTKYHRTYAAKRAQQAVQDMKQYREACMERVKASKPTAFEVVL